MSDRTRIDGQKLDMHPRRVADWQDARNDWEKAKEVYPIYVEFSPYGVCNHECTFCSVDYILDRKDHPMISYDVFARTLEDMAKRGILSVMFAGAGEPTLYHDKAAKKDLADIIVLCDELGIDTAITTNATGLDEDFSERAFKAKGLKWVRASFNAGTPESYAMIHRTKESDFHKVVKNLTDAVRIRNRIGAGVQILGQIVAVPAAQGVKNRRTLQIYQEYPTNIDTIVPLAKLLRDLGADNLAVKPYKQHTVELHEEADAKLGVTRSDMYHGTSYSNDAWLNLFDELQREETKTFEITIRRGAMTQQDAEWRGYNTCYSTPYFWAYVEADGEVWGCSAHLGRIENGKEIGDHRFRFGNVNEQSFTEIWHGDRRQACWEYTRKPPSEGGLDVSKCMKGCQMDMPNVYLWNLQNPEPTRNFVK
ncbi:MAG: radical SAM protein [Patescibacteria group bacterium]|jgi:MoaA/NifB/PqqE/SkfB family radical SAM enzyme